MPYYTLAAEQFAFLDDQTKEQVQRYLKAHGIDPQTTVMFTIDGDLRGIAVVVYDLDPLGNAQIDPNTMEAITHNEWVKLKDGEGPPTFLKHMVSSVGANSNQFVGDGRILDSRGRTIPR